MNAGEAATNWRDADSNRPSRSTNNGKNNDLNQSFREEDEYGDEG